MDGASDCGSLFSNTTLLELVCGSPGVSSDGQAAFVHDGDALGVAGHGAVVGDEHEGEAEVAP